MKHYVYLQYRPRDAARPEDEPMRFEVKSEDGGLLLVPNIGDHVVFLRPKGADGEEQIEGIVENRLFYYLGRDTCTINVVVTDSDVSSAILIKE